VLVVLGAANLVGRPESWEDGIRRVARYRVQYDIADPSDALGPAPEQGEQQHDWKQARDAIAQGERRLGRDVATERDVDLGIGL
jgi:hypothetical protein